ncbi:AbrB/MazE/SpoVT family DNA-binding domain-containing protein [Candidatus Woesearchaeota archaeon]|nr:AbrB/MazE/SpoVT family DNA-binding domain-containing protein [Candidatus Woesearchaeota archaeon]
MKRKVNQIGPATLMVSLPSKWVKQHNIKKGDEIDVEERSGNLIIGGEGSEPLNKTVINLRDIPDIENASDHFYWMLFSNAYKRGYDEIEVIFPDVNVAPRVQAAISNLLGYEMFDQTSKRCIIRSLANEREEEFERMVRKSFLLTKQAAELCYNDLNKGKLDNMDNIINIKKNVQKVTDFCRRLINKKIYKNSEIAQYYYVILMRIILITNRFSYIHRYLDRSKKKVSKGVIEFFGKVRELLELFYETYYKKKIDNIEKIDRTRIKLIKKAEEFFSSKNSADIAVTEHLSEVIRLIGGNSSLLMGIIL